MKKVNFKNALMALAVALVFLLMGTEQVGAQVVNATIASAPTPPPGTSYMNSNTAQDALTSIITDLKLTLETLPVGSAVYNATLLQINYYNGILAELLAGKSVPQSIVNGLGYVSNTDVPPPPSKQQSSVLMQDATNLLTN